MIVFDRLWKTMKQKGISQYHLYKNYGISRAQIQRLKKNESVTTHTLYMLCQILDCELSDIAEYQKEDSFTL